MHLNFCLFWRLGQATGRVYRRRMGFTTVDGGGGGKGGYFHAMNAAAPKRDAPAAVLVTKKMKPRCPAVPRRGPEAGILIHKYSL